MPSVADEMREFLPRALSRIAAGARASVRAPDSDLEELWQSVVIRMVLMVRLVFPSLNTTQQDDIVRIVIERLLGTSELKRFLTQSDPEKYVSALLRKAGRELIREKKRVADTNDERPQLELVASGQVLVGESQLPLRKKRRKTRIDDASPRAIRLLPVRVMAIGNEAPILAALNDVLEELGFVPRV